MKTAAILAGILLPFTASATLIRVAVPALWVGSRTLAISLAAVAGIGCSSLIFVATLFVWGSVPALYVPLEIALWIVVVILSRRGFRNPTDPSPALTLSRAEVAAGLLFTGTLIVSLLHFYWTIVNAPSGEWDAWAIWNLRARFLYRGLEGTWRDAFDTAMRWSHPDYPLLLPSSTARLWVYSRGESAVPIILAFLFQYATVGILVGAFDAAGRRFEGFLAGAVLLATDPFNAWGPAQVSDVPVAAFVLAATVLLAWFLEERDRSCGPAAALVTFCAACAAWTKNEGFVFAAASCTVLAGSILHRRRDAVRVATFAAAGLAGPLAVLLYFKRSLAPPSLFQSLSVVNPPQQVWDLDRHQYILGSFVRELWSWTNTMPIGIIPLILAYSAAAAVTRGLRPLQLLAGLPLLVLLAGFYAAYVVTPLNLQWHIDTSLSRLLVQVWPAAVYVLFSLSEPIVPTASSVSRVPAPGAV